jgi:DNA invertase Pin-like site-specific DNA recombinase
MLLGYMRVSRTDGTQSFDLQQDALVAAGVPHDRLYEDYASGKREDRPGLASCLKALQPGNTLVIWRLDRLRRDLKHLITIVDTLTERGIGLKVLTGQGAQLDTTTANGRMLFGIFAVFAEYERALLIERTRAGLRAARARGRVGGRPRRVSKTTVRMLMAAMAHRTQSVTAIASVLCQEGLPFGLKKPKNGTWHGCWECSTSLGERSTPYYTYAIVRPVVSQNSHFARKGGSWPKFVIHGG